MTRHPPRPTLFPSPTLCRSSCGLEPSRVVAYKPLLDEALAIASHAPGACLVLQRPELEATLQPGRDRDWASDRKSTRLNSSHANISYAVFCLTKKRILASD